MKDDGKLTYYMRWVAGATAILIAYGSAKLSVAGIGIGGDLWWLSWVIAISLFVAEFMVNGKHSEINWLMLLMGFGAYAYSISTNIVGIGNYMTDNGTSVIDAMGKVTMYAGGVFMDIYPELVLRWALGESKVGDAIGNLVKTWNNPEILTKSFSTTTVSGGYKVESKKVNSDQRRKELQAKYRKPVNVDMDDDEDDIPSYSSHKPVSPLFR